MNPACKIVSCQGKDNVILALRQYADGTKDSGGEPVAGFVDADFDSLLGKDESLPWNAILTDAHDFETMVLSASLLQRFLDHTFKEPVLKAAQSKLGLTIEEWAIDVAYEVGKMKYASQRLGWLLPFREVRITDYLSPSLAFDLDAYWTRATQGKRWGKATDQRRKVDAIAPGREKWRWVVNGHDALSLAFFALGRESGAGMSQIEFERGLRMYYDYRFFVQTSTHEAIQQWQAQSGATVLPP